MCGFNDEVPLPESAKGVTVNKELVKTLHNMAGAISSSLDGQYCISQFTRCTPLLLAYENKAFEFSSTDNNMRWAEPHNACFAYYR